MGLAMGWTLGIRHEKAQIRDFAIRAIDVLLALAGLIIFLPAIGVAMFAIWLNDHGSPIYFARRVGWRGQPFWMVKLRSMVTDADKIGGPTSSSSDPRITAVGRIVRKYKLDELTQLWNVLVGDMSLVGPRPNVPRATAAYTEQERALLSVRPGVTDFSSIVFSDEGEILQGAEDPDLLYEQIIRPWKSRLGLFYLDHRSVVLNLKLIAMTAVALCNRKAALRGIVNILSTAGADPELIRICRRDQPLFSSAPPGASEVIQELPYSRHHG
jgi:lipopolysaccharide/colanic/teichoic acid biosynthesis glycosyltransferase